MADIIQLLPDNIANQIAAGEVIQRPASAVKELLENAVDAGATEIRLIISDAGKALVQVIDNGKGMSPTDARMAFERHATSKIKQIDDLFRIKTMGFRGEALASVAAVAQVEIKTRRAEDELGTYLEIENSRVVKQEPCAAPAGTSICMKNLFFNVPARRNFLKSNAAELRHIIDEFIRVAMAFPDIFFSLTSNGQEMFHLEKGSLKQRIVQILGNQYNAKLVSVSEETDYMNIYGFVGKPETARKTRGDQYFFVNNRFIKSAYLNHAVNTAFEGMIGKDSFPGYVIYIDLDPAQVDINVHPTKQEIKFEDEKIIYAFVQAAVKHALAQSSIAPSLDFTLNADIQQLDAVNKPFTTEQKDVAVSSSLYKTFTQKNQAHFIEPENKSELRHWKDFFTEPADKPARSSEQKPAPAHDPLDFLLAPKKPQLQVLTDSPLLQLHNTYIIAPTDSGFILIHQQLAHERILYNRYSVAAHGKKMASQQTLFPATLELAPADAALLNDLLPDLQAIGYQLSASGNNNFTITGIPADVLQGNETHAIELLIEQFKHFSSEVTFSRREKLVRCMARQQAIKAGQSLSQKEMFTLAEELFACSNANITPTGNPTFIEYKEDQLDRMFGK
ncbi:DNA mismatch repair endonuclease MutL [Sediminibacterium ginsengisoli]|uniref:DNA mismatch repair protein MutL n=1 Tax=Sediminibacterium ginsengisoli TaxID=413434 RepID=A0A1T4JT50_9BACT|nr:DNA mismatch repair endonuclease MutL [Sediminibacterium ginsengisoli]SJZ33328.1 DNA mismatch repair protein MutL [Sediminibacterium ginsengisoli]